VSLKFFSKHILVAGILASAVGSAMGQPATPPKPTPAATPPAATPPAAPDSTAPAPAPPTIQIPAEIMTVNGTGLSSSDWIQSLYAVAGPRVIEEWINIFAAREACRLSGITLGQKDAEAEADRLIKNLAANISPPPTKDLTEAEKGNLLSQFAQSQGLNPIELGWKIQQSAYLRALGKAAKDQTTGKPAVNVTDESVNDEFERENGDRANVMVYIFQDMLAAQKVITEAADEKKTFPAVADEKKIPRQPVVIPTSDSVKFEPATFKGAVKQVKAKDISAVTPFTDPADPSKTVYVVLYVDEIKARTPMTPAEVATEKDKLKARMTDSSELQVGLNIVQSMRASKKITIVINDPILSHYYEQIQAAQAAAATQRAAATTAPAAPGH
jgi:hypothetical protein